MTEFLLYTCIYLFSAVASVLLSQKLGLGSVLGYLIAGILIGPAFGLVGEETAKIQHIAEFGVVMMLFLVGLELAPTMLWQMRHKLLGLGGLQVLLTVGAVTALSIHFFQQTWQIGVAIGCILALSSTAIVLQTFAEKKLISTPGGQAGFAVLLFQDVAAIPMLMLLPLLAITSTSNHTNIHGSDFLMGQPGWVHVIASIAAIALILLTVKFIVPSIFRFISKTRLGEMFTMFTLALVVGIAELMSFIGLSPALGAFIAGVALANSSYRHEMESHLQPFKGLLLGIFFITVGAGMNFGLLKHEFWIIIGLTIGVLCLKSIILWPLGKLFKLPFVASTLFALSLAQAGEFGFVLLSIAKHSFVLSEALSDRISMVIALSMVFTPLMFILYEKIIVPRYSKQHSNHRQDDTIHEENPIILLGHGQFGQQINRMLLACGFHTTVIDNKAETVEQLTQYGIKVYYGDATRPELLTSAGLANAQLIILCINNYQQSIEIVEYIRRHYPDLPIIARAHDRRHAYELHHAGASYIILDTSDSAIHSGRIALETLGIDHDKAQKLSRFYEARDRHQLEQLTSLYDPDQLFIQNNQMVTTAQNIDAETTQMMQRLMRDEPVDWQENPDSWTRLKKGIKN